MTRALLLALPTLAALGCGGDPPAAPVRSEQPPCEAITSLEACEARSDCRATRALTEDGDELDCSPVAR